MAIKGSLAEASLPEVIQLLSYSLKSGCLSITDGANLGNIFLKDGKIIHATILKRTIRLGDSMIEKKVLQGETLRRALDLQKQKRGKRLGEILVEMDAISRRDLEKELARQIEETVHTMLGWDKGYFNFETGLLPSSAEHTVLLPAQDLLLGGARQTEDWRKIRDKLPAAETVMSPKENVNDFDLTDPERKILSMVNGVNTVDDLVKGSGLDYHTACKAIYVLVVAGVVEKPKHAPERAAEPADINEQKETGLALYQRAEYDAAETEFRKILDRDPQNGEALFYLGLIDVARRNDESALGYLTKALETGRRVSILIDMGHVCGRMGSHEESVKHLEEARAMEPDNVKVLLNLGITYFHQGEMAQAARVLEKCLELSDGIVTPYFYLAAIHLKSGDVDKAAALLAAASGKFPRLPALKNNLALLHEAAGRNEEAEEVYRQALAVEPQNTAALRNLARLYYRSGIYGLARECYERIPDDERDGRVLLDLGRLYLFKGDTKAAVDQWRRAMATNPGDERLGRDIEILDGSL